MLTVVTPEEAIEIILSCVHKSLLNEEVGLYEACNRIVAQDIKSAEDLPSFNRSTVDGIAVKSEDTFGCSDSLPSMLEYSGKILMGQDVNECLESGKCMEIPTGGMLPSGGDSVVMVEYTENIGDNYRYVTKPCAPLENVIRKGDDCRINETVVKKGTLINAKNIAVLAALGIDKIKVVISPTVGIISTGDELVYFSQKPLASQVRDVNSVTLFSCLTKLGCKAKVYPIIPDNDSLLERAIKKATSECDCVLISGGSSVGEKDSVSRILTKLGEIKFHGIAIKPGKPTMFATLNDIPVFGLPGHPAAAFFSFNLFVKPAILKMLGTNQNGLFLEAICSQNIPSNHGRQEIVAVKLDENIATPLFAKSGLVSVLSKADGYIEIDRNSEGILKGDKVKVILF